MQKLFKKKKNLASESSQSSVLKYTLSSKWQKENSQMIRTAAKWNTHTHTKRRNTKTVPTKGRSGATEQKETRIPYA